MFTIAIVGEKASVTDALTGLIESYAAANGEKFKIKSFKDVVTLIGDKSDLNIIFLDIDCFDGEGMRMAKLIREARDFAIMFLVSSSSVHAVEGYSVNALGYLLKPVTQERVNFYLDKAKKYLNKRSTHLIIKNKQGYVRIAVEDIVYVEIRDHSIFLHLYKNETSEVKKTNGSLTEFAAFLERHSFARSGNYCLVNMNFITSVDNDTVNLKGADTTLPVTRTYKKQFGEKYEVFKKTKVENAADGKHDQAAVRVC